MFNYFRCFLILMLFVNVTQASSQTLNLDSERVLIITHADSEWHNTSLTDLAEKLIQHFTPHTQSILSTDYESGMVSHYTKIVVLGVAYGTPISEILLSDLIATQNQIVWLGYGIGQLTARSAKYGFTELDFQETQEEAPTLVYQGKTYPTKLHGYSMVHVTNPAVKIWSVLMRKNIFVPHILQGGNLWFVNSMLDDVWGPQPTIAPSLVFADILHEIFQTKIARKHHAVLRLEDVSTHIPAQRLEAIVNYLASEKVPFAIGLIPNQRLVDGSLSPLAEKISLVRVLRRAQNEARGTIILHGFFHTFGTGEDFEFWDEMRNAPLQGESEALYACKLGRGIEILRDLGLNPRFWETPHYMSSPLGYRTFGTYFSHAIENRLDENWTPYPFGPDRYGQVVISENLDYIAPSEGRSVDRMLERANLLQIVRDAWAVGFAHPAVVPVREIAKLVKGLRALGYEFEDVGAIATKVNSAYQPSENTQLLTNIYLASRINVPMAERWMNKAVRAVSSSVSHLWDWSGLNIPDMKANAAQRVEDSCTSLLEETPQHAFPQLSLWNWPQLRPQP